MPHAQCAVYLRMQRRWIRNCRFSARVGSFQWYDRLVGLRPKKITKLSAVNGSSWTEMKVVLTGVMDVIFSGNGVLKEIRNNRGQRAGHVGVATFVGKMWKWRVVDDCGEVALTPGLRSRGGLQRQGRDYAPGDKTQEERRPAN